MKNYKNLSDSEYFGKFYLLVGDCRFKPFNSIVDCAKYAKRKIKEKFGNSKETISICYMTSDFVKMIHILYNKKQLAEYKNLKAKLFLLNCDYQFDRIDKDYYLTNAIEYHKQSKIGFVPPMPWQML